MLYLFSGFGNSCSENNESIMLKDSSEGNVKIPAGLQKLVEAYPGFLEYADENNLYWKDGTVMIYDDGITDKTHDEMLNNPDLEDMISQKYVKGREWNEPPPENFEPGRIRYEPFFLKMYGNNSNEVRNNLVNIKWADGSVISFSRINGAADSLEKVAEELSQLPDEFQKYLKNIGGTFVWRNIAGTDRLSNHSFGTAIDINTKYSDYWKWNNNVTYINRIPVEIAEVFEKYGFIWGGKWYHYDTMHFEFRPELTAD
ncbi:MAG TPA: M15 family metallopeptidase [Ignavibacteria bacterium]|nr:M15 family metallopeptidase [Ignavibacteria bacterium]HRJ98687.1 M15 family metallopeptidase [Ignavibacteria bacterium]